VTPPHGSPAPSGLAPRARTLDELPIPTRARGVELVGEMRGSGYRNPPALVRRADGQTIQLTKLLYQVLAAIDGRRTYADIAAAVGARIGRTLTAADAGFLIETKLRPLGVLRRPDGTDPEVERANPLLALRLKYVVTDPERTARITAPFAALFRPGIVLAVLAAFAVSVWWVMFDKGLGNATHEAFHDPRLLLLVVGLTVLSAGFHEFGHAAACRYGGATPGAMGAGLYLVWPAFYTEVTDSYRLGRWGRLRVDLGGLYFNAVFAVGVMGAWWLTGWDALLLVVATQVLQMVRQLTPLVRFDGYHILADLTGVPDLFHHIKPTLLGLLPHRWGRPEHRVLKPWARAVVTLWVAIVVPVLAALLVLLVLVLPRLAATAWEGLGVQQEVLAANWAEGDLASVGVRILSILTLSIPVLSIGYLLARIVRRTFLRVRAATSGDQRKRFAAVVAGLFLLGGVAWAWWPGERYVPIQPAERGAVQDLFTPAVLPVPDQDDGAPAADDLAPAGRQAAPADGATGGPQLALVVVPSSSSTDEAVATSDALAPVERSASGPAPGAAAPDDRRPGDDWPFPWEPPAAVDEGDNRAMSVVTRDGGSTYQVALAYVWVTDGSPVRHHNEAWALASCVDCTAVAVAFQSVFIVGGSDEVVPANVAVAATYDCEDCVTHAVAVQLITTLTEMPDQRTLAELQQVLGSLQGLEGTVRTLPIAEVYLQLKAAEAEILRILTEGGYLALAAPRLSRCGRRWCWRRWPGSPTRRSGRCADATATGCTSRRWSVRAGSSRATAPRR
jgi:putative peptide zinc metalloprotease protein